MFGFGAALKPQGVLSPQPAKDTDFQGLEERERGRERERERARERERGREGGLRKGGGD